MTHYKFLPEQGAQRAKVKKGKTVGGETPPTTPPFFFKIFKKKEGVLGELTTPRSFFSIFKNYNFLSLFFRNIKLILPTAHSDRSQPASQGYCCIFPTPFQEGKSTPTLAVMPEPKNREMAGTQRDAAKKQDALRAKSKKAKPWGEVHSLKVVLFLNFYNYNFLSLLFRNIQWVGFSRQKSAIITETWLTNRGPA